MENTLNQKVQKATAWSSITEIIAKLILPIVNIILARLLVPEDFGVVATITMIISFAEIFTDAGFQKYIIQHEFSTQDDLDNSTNVAFWTNIVFSIAIVLGIVLFRNAIAELVGSPDLGGAIAIASLIIIVVAFSSIQMARYKRDFDFKGLFFVRTGTSLIPLFVTIPLAIIFRNFWALLIGTFASNIFNAAILTWKSKWRPKFYYSFKLFKKMFAFSGWTLLESVSIWLTSYIGVFIVGKHLDDYYLGIYKTAMSTVNSFMGIITAAITPVLFSTLSRYQNDRENFSKAYYSFQRLTAIFVLPMGIGVFLYSDLITRILLGKQWMEASGFIGWWGLTNALTMVLSYFSSEVYRSKGNPKISLFSQILHLLFLIPTLIISVQYGFKVLYISRSLIRLQGILVGLIIMHVAYGLKMMQIIRNIFPMAISSLIMGLIGYLLQQISVSMLWQFASILICVSVYFAVLLVISPSLRKDLLQTKFIKKLKNQ